MLSWELYDKAYCYLESEIPLSELENWYAPKLPILMRDPKSSDARVIAVIELGLAEMNNNILSENQLKDRLRNTLENHFVIRNYTNLPDIEIITTFSSKTAYTLDKYNFVTSSIVVQA